MKPNRDHPSHKLAALQRIKAVAQPTYIERNVNDLKVHNAVLCYRCGAKIRKLVPDDKFEDSREINGQRVIFQRLIMASLPNYCEVTVEFDDGSANAHPMCRPCADEVAAANDPEELEHLYAVAMQEWFVEEELGGGEVRWDLQAHRKPTRIAKVHVPV